ncbi:hypothetical protein OESDEN_14067 [Oesophagostomum dentatum]|uniref:Uncharacterized protein n=1 Tax=Oesophagostomum dentatum TaxID=61180 RepID=A0A0B1SQP3_OESDE|nr:hypothetical protein OESDEN_14067 [Oesophagostomum dentatum]
MRKSPQSSLDAVMLDDSNVEAVFQDSLPRRSSRIKKKFKVGGEVTHS